MIVNEAANYPGYAQVNAAGQMFYTWLASTSDVRALQRVNSADRIAATYFNNDAFTVDVTLTDGASHQVALYFLDWDDKQRVQQIDLLDAASGALLDRRVISNFAGGVYLVWNLSGNVRFRIAKTAGPNAVMSGLFFGGGAPTVPPRPVPAVATLLKIDGTSQGNWRGVYGTEGYNVVNDSTSYPGYTQVSASGESAYTWADATGERRALQRGQTSGRIAATWFSNTSFTLDLKINDGRNHQVAIYFLDWDDKSRSQQVEVLDAGNNARLDSRIISRFAGGQYLIWNIGGHVKFRVTRVSGPNAVVSGLFFGPGTGSSGGGSGDTTPPVISSVSVSNVTGGSATISWATSEAADSRVEYGTSTSYGNAVVVSSPMSANHQINLIGLSASTLYHYRVISKDASGNQAQSGDFTFTTGSVAPPPVSGAGDPESPREWLDTALPPANGNTITVNDGDNLQAALNSAAPGDTIVIQAGATFIAPSGGFVLPAKSNPNRQWIIVRTANPGGLPGAGGRVHPSHAGAMPKILSRDTTPAIATTPGTNFWRLIGLEVSITSNAVGDVNTSGVATNYGLIALGNGGETTLNDQPTDLVIDRCYIHGLPRKNVRRGVALNSRRTAIIDSYIAEIHELGADSQAICGWSGAGPFKIVNNFLEGAGENVLFGGADPRTPNLVPADIEFRRNHLFKPRSWYSNDPSFGGVAWSVKNSFELKNARRVIVEGNVFENNWSHAQVGFAILFTVRNQDGGAPWSTIEDVAFINNIVRHTSSGVNILGRDDNHPSGLAKRLKVKNNVFEDLNSGQWGGPGRFLQITDTVDAKFENNTIFHSGNICAAYTNRNTPSNTGFVYRNNISAHNEYGWFGADVGIGLPALNTYFPSAIFEGNILAGGAASAYPAGNHFPATLDAVGFVNRAGGDYRLSSSSSFKNRGTDGRDPGADVDAVNAATAGVVR